LVRLGHERRLRLIVHNTIGYLGPQEPLLRRSGTAGRRGFWQGCGCGRTSVGISPQGDIKGCANQVTAPFIVGNVRSERLATIWQDRERWHWLDPTLEQMRGDCARCALNRVCGAGCTALAYSASGELFDNPYCLRRISRAKERSLP
jgi:radical SAM protein with 4Fe4S-binding SPASM domain